MHLDDGTLLQGGKYRIVRFISSGGFGCTYQAEQTILGVRVAIKELFVRGICNRDEVTSEISVGVKSMQNDFARLKSKFIDEARALYQLRHNNIVRVTDIFEENGTAYYVMDYIDGMSLENMVKQNGPLPEAAMLRYIGQICDALGYVHSYNRLHLDIKPANIMINRADDRAILIDFGASKQYDENGNQNSTLMAIKTVGYAPIEQMAGTFETFNAATDIYSLGATMYYALTGTTPPNSLALMGNDNALPPLPPHVTNGTRMAILWAMRSRIDERPQRIVDLVGALNHGQQPQCPRPTTGSIGATEYAPIAHEQDNGAPATLFSGQNDGQTLGLESQMISEQERYRAQSQDGQGRRTAHNTDIYDQMYGNDTRPVVSQPAQPQQPQIPRPQDCRQPQSQQPQDYRQPRDTGNEPQPPYMPPVPDPGQGAQAYPSTQPGHNANALTQSAPTVQQPERTAATQYGDMPSLPPRPKPNKKVALWIALAAVAIAVIATLAIVIPRILDDKKPIGPIGPTAGETESPMPIPVDTLGVEPGGTSGVDIIVNDVDDVEDVEAVGRPVKPKEPKPTVGTLQLGASTWSGGIKSGQPDGNGTMHYHTSTTVCGYPVHAGYRIEGTFEGGKLVVGAVYDDEGNKIKTLMP